MAVNDAMTVDRDHLQTEFEQLEEEMETTINSYREVLANAEASEGDSKSKRLLKEQMVIKYDVVAEKKKWVEKNEALTKQC